MSDPFFCHCLGPRQSKPDGLKYQGLAEGSGRVNQPQRGDKNKHPGTGSWFVKGTSFATSLQNPNSFLWLVGFAGCGKSALCSTAIQYAFRHRRGEPRVGVAFFFFTFIDENKQALMGCLFHIARDFKDVCIVLDESPRNKHRQAMLVAISVLHSWQMPGLHLLVSSRDKIDIREELGATEDQIVEMRNELVDQDIARFVAQHLQDSRHLRRWAEYHDLIEEALTTRAKGVFRWVECQFKALASCPESEDLLGPLLNSLPKILDETYERMLNNILLALRDYAQQILVMLCFAKRPLTVAELMEGIAVQLGDSPAFNPNRRLENIDAIQMSFFSLYRKAHYKTIRYKQKGPDGAAFYYYDAQNWPDHFRSGRADHRSKLLVMQFLSNADDCLKNWAHVWEEDCFQSGQLKSLTPPPLYYAARLGLGFVVDLLTAHHPGSSSVGAETNTDKVVQQLLDSNRDINEQVAECGSALQAASEEGHVGMVKGCKTALQVALSNRHIGIAKLLLANNADVNAEAGHYGTALQVVSALGSAEMVRLLLDNNADVNVEAGHCGAALIDASVSGHDEVVQLLLANGANINAYGTYGTALQVASDQGHAKVVKTLLAGNADVNETTGNDRPALYSASSQGHVEIVKLLLANNAGIDAKFEPYGTALITATTGGEWGTALQEAPGNQQIIQLLLENDAGSPHKRPPGKPKNKEHQHPAIGIKYRSK
ncbi:ankyrin repeat-containing domain protein [Dactylonectria estremocensis]|uniref:Ankyrin repeat-containing domain protein n=1 Tax=Dactylonectria estremocensis TaxID=1079267 RepID=A0A9P9JAA3_9HYPO|nr:ankyrin repeat-containing domain protein [Dactylonectria estremocensis]